MPSLDGKIKKITIGTHTIKGNGKAYHYKRNNAVIPDYRYYGKPYNKDITGKTKEEVKEKLKIIYESLNHDVIKIAYKISISDWLDIWFENCVEGILSTSTIDHYYRCIKKIKKYFNHKIMLTITVINIQEFYHYLLLSLKPQSIRIYHTILLEAFNFAKSHKIVGYNPVRDAHVPKGKSRERNILNINQISEFIKCCNKLNYGNFFIFLLATALRKSEGMGLTIDRISFENSHIMVCQQLEYVPARDNQPSYYQIKEHTKTYESRNNKIPVIAMNCIKEELKKQEEWKKTNSNYCNNLNLVFVNPDGSCYKEQTILDEYHRLTKILNIDMTIHDLRHTAASVLYYKTKSVQTVQRYLGHRDMNVTYRYIHVFETDLDKVAEAFDSVLDTTLKQK